MIYDDEILFEFKDDDTGENLIWFRVGPLFRGNEEFPNHLWIDVLPSGAGPMFAMTRDETKALIKHLNNRFKFTLRAKIVYFIRRLIYA